jgi:hypothetical protein
VPFDGAALAAGTIGVGLLWAALNNKSLLDTTKDIIKGTRPLPGATTPDTVVNPSAGIPGVTVGIPAGVASAGTPTANIGLGELMAAAYGWTGNNWLCLKTGWQEESGWSQYAANDPGDPYNHAYGIPQANPGTKMASAGSDWESSPSTQIKWGLGYIKATYGSPSQVPGWTPDGPAAGYVGY